jgi:hypothetical protein
LYATATRPLTSGRESNSLQFSTGARALLTARLCPSVVLRLFALLLAAAHLIAADIQPGMTVERDFGPVTFLVTVDRSLAQAEIAVKIGGQVLAQRDLTPAANIMTLDLLNGSVGIRGSLAAQFAYPKARSTIFGDFKVTNGITQTPYRGDVLGWLSPDSLILKRQRTWLTPELFAQTNVLLDTSQSVQVQLITGAQVILTVTLSQGANSAVVTQGFNVGTVSIQPNLTLQLQPASPTQEGEVYLKGTFSSSNLPVVNYAGAIATWSYIQPPS